MPDAENYFCISRKGVASEINLLDYESYMLLKLVLDGVSLVKITELEIVDADRLGIKLKGFIEQGFITGFFLQC